VSLYGAVAAARRSLYARGVLKSEFAPVPVVSVGNLTWGGTGKTPFVAALVSYWQSVGRRVGVASRGYGRRSRGTVLVSDGNRLLAGVAEAGDEPYLLARRFPGAIVAVAERRVDAAREAARLGAEIVILDDAFQHLAIRRDLDVVLVDAGDPFGGGPPPRGRGREDAPAIARADLVVVTRARRGEESAADREVPRFTAAPIYHCAFRFAGWFRGGEPSASPAAPGWAVCAVGNPESFRATLAESGAAAAGFAAFRDHHAYSAADVRRIEESARRAGATALLTTEKDEVKLAGRTQLPLFAARVEAEIFEAGFFADAARLLAGRSR
jgi:tetraacyldisaccharide 4'-kinase